MTTLYLIRHAEAEGNLYRRIHGQYDSLITDNGYRQIAALEKRFADVPIDVVYSSDLFRTMTTARSITVPKGLPLHTRSDLRELSMGEWEDRTFGAVRHSDPRQMDLFNRTDPAWEVEKAETFFQLGDRLYETVGRLAGRHPDQSVAMFSHGMAIRQFLGRVKNIPPEEWHAMPHGDNTAVTCLTFDGERFTIQYEMDNSHLPEDISTLARQAWWRRDGSKKVDINLWYRPIDWEKEGEVYLEARRDAWTCTHGTEVPFDGDAFLQGAEDCLSQTPWGVTVAMAGDQIAGVLQLDGERYQADNAGYIPFCYIVPQRRGYGLGVQLIGQAVAVFRPMGRDKLRLRCAPYNQRAQRFYQKHGFVKIGEEENSRVPLDILEKYIGYER